MRSLKYHYVRGILTVAKLTLPQLERHLFAAADSRLMEVRKSLKPDDLKELVLDLFREDLAGQLDRYVSAHRQQIVAALENLFEKYHVPLSTLETERDAVAKKLAGYMKDLGYRR